VPGRDSVKTETRSILFMDLASWSNLTSPQIATYLHRVLPQISDIVARFNASHVNTWGDALIATFGSVREAAECALDIRDYFRRATEADGVPPGLAPRLSLHLGEVIVEDNPLLGRPDVFGAAVHLAARLEPVTPRGNVYCTDLFASCLMSTKGLGPVAHQIGTLSLPKNFGTVVAFAVTGPGEDPPISLDNTPKSQATEPVPSPANPAELTADRRSFEALQAVINSDWIVSWEEWQANSPQYLEKQHVHTFRAYEFESRKPERTFFSAHLRAAHEQFIAAIKRFLHGTGRIMVTDHGSTDWYVISVKAAGQSRWIEDYSERYERQVEEVTNLTNGVWTAWQHFMRIAAVTFIS
jgi:class 3 adenylate cyclase